MSQRTTEFAAAITGDAAGAIAALEQVKARVQDTAKAAESANTKVADSTEVLIRNSEKAAKGVAAITTAMYALEAEGSARVLALGGAVGNFADLLGPQGKVVSGIAIVASSIVALFLQAKEKSREAAESMIADIRNMAAAGNLAALAKREQQLFSGDRLFSDPDAKETTFGRGEGDARLARQRAITGEGLRLFNEELAKIDDGALVELRAALDRLADPKAPKGLLGVRTELALLEKELRRLPPSLAEGGAAIERFNEQRAKLQERAASLRKTERALAAELATVVPERQQLTGVEVSRDNNRRIREAAEAEAKAAERAAEKVTSQLTSARDAAAALFQALSGGDAAEKAAAQIQQWATEAERANVPATEIAGTVQLLTAAFKQASDTAAAKKLSADLSSLTADLAALQAQASGNALQSLDVAYARITAELEKKAEASAEAAKEAKRLGDAESAEKLRALASGYREQVTVAVKRRDGLKDLAKLSQQLAAAQEVEARFTKAANASYSESVPTITDVRRAEAELLRGRTLLQQLANDPNADPAIRAEAQKLLTSLVEREAKAAGNVAGGVSNAATNAAKLGAGIQTSAQAALALVQVLGQGNSELAQMLAGVVSVGAGLQKLGSAAQAAGGFTKLLGSAEGIGATLSSVASIAGGTIALAGALGIGKRDPEREKQLEVQKENTNALRLLTTRIGDLVNLNVSGNQFGRVQSAVDALLDSLLTDLTQIVDGIEETIRVPAAANTKLDPRAFFADLGLSLDEIEEVAKSLGITLDGTAGSFEQLRLALGAVDFALFSEDLDGYSRRLALWSQILGATDDPLDRITNRFRALANVSPELAELFDLSDLTKNTGIQRLRGQVAALLTEALTLDPASPEAAAFFRRFGDLKPDEFLSLFSDILAGLDEFQEGLTQFADAMSVFQAQAAVFGLEGEAFVTGLVNTFANQFPALQGLLDGIDLSTADGIATATERLKALFTSILEGGVTVEEEGLADAITQIISQLLKLPAALTRVTDTLTGAIDAAQEKFEIFGTSAADQFIELGAFLKAKFPFAGPTGLADVLGPTFQQDIKTENGRKRLKASIGDAINAILADGVVTEAERPLLDALKQLFALVLSATEEATEEAERIAQEAEDAAAQREQKRQANLGERARNARTTIALNDLTGADAFTAALEGYSQAFADLFSQFDVTTLDGVTAAKAALKDIYDSLATLTDDEILTRFGMTRDEVIGAITEVDGSLDGLAQSFRDLKTKGIDFVNNLSIEFLNATGQGLEAVRLQSRLWVEQMIATAKALGVFTPEIEQQIRAIGAARVNAAAEQANRQPAGSASTERSAAAANAARRSNTTVVGDFGGLSEITAQSLAGLLREIAINTGREGALVAAILGRGPLPSLSALQFPAYPAAASGGGGIAIGTVNVHIGAIAAEGLPPAAAGNAVAREIAKELGRLATAEIRFLGSGVA